MSEQSTGKTILGIASDSESVDNDMKIEDWSQVWDTEKPIWHLDFHSPHLVRFLDRVTNGRKELKFFFPMCGKAVDMKWMYDEGHTVVGVEAATKPCEDFFQQNNIPYETEELKELEGTLYKSKDARIRIYCCDYFKLSPMTEKDFDVVFDRGSLTSVIRPKRPRYVKIMLSMMKADYRYLLMTFDYDETKHQGLPLYISLEEIQELYGSKCQVELLLVDKYWTKPEELKIDNIDERVHLIMPK